MCPEHLACLTKITRGHGAEMTERWLPSPYPVGLQMAGQAVHHRLFGRPAVVGGGECPTGTHQESCAAGRRFFCWGTDMQVHSGLGFHVRARGVAV